ncbi:MAG TPA: prepilin peptidase [Gemmatimonadaceae bacterium]|jgi:leader peptidase (prepilin peptidase)/N-methyltransferase
MIALYFIIVFFVGASIGSFLNVCIARWPAEESVVRPRSRCPRCGAGIAWFDNVPVVSWFVLRAKCRKCGLPISSQYPLVEAVVGLMWVAAVFWYGPGSIALRVAIFATILLGVAITDAKHYLIPDGFTVTGLLLGGAAAIVGAYIGLQEPFAGPVDAMFGACVGAGAITIIGWLGEVALKKEAMGFGDTTLMAMCGVALGPGRALLTIFVGAAFAAAAFLLVVFPVGFIRAKRRGQKFEAPLVPFGVFLAPAAVFTLLFGTSLIGWYIDRVVG